MSRDYKSPEEQAIDALRRIADYLERIAEAYEAQDRDPEREKEQAK